EVLLGFVDGGVVRLVGLATRQCDRLHHTYEDECRLAAAHEGQRLVERGFGEQRAVERNDDFGHGASAQKVGLPRIAPSWHKPSKSRRTFGTMGGRIELSGFFLYRSTDSDSLTHFYRVDFKG